LREGHVLVCIVSYSKKKKRKKKENCKELKKIKFIKKLLIFNYYC
jgi:hypothetical protein